MGFGKSIKICAKFQTDPSTGIWVWCPVESFFVDGINWQRTINPSEFGAVLPEDSAKPPPLDYATPIPPKNVALKVIFGVLGVLAGLFGTLVTFLAVLWIHACFTSDWQRVDGEYVFNMCATTAIGPFSLYLCYRWINFAQR
jgi:hypothetical protein